MVVLTSLLHSTGDSRVDELLISMVPKLEEAFPDRIRSYFLTGSFHEGTAIPGSDIDGVAVFRGDISQDESSSAQKLIDSLSRPDLRLDFKPIAETQLSNGARLALPGAATLIYGDDIRGELPTPSIATFRRQTVGVCLGYLKLLREIDGSAPAIESPLAYPDEAGEFFGYELADQRLGDAGTRTLVSTVTALATAQVVVHKEQIVLSKRDAVQAYKELDTGIWSRHVEELYLTCREKWHYGIPDDREQRRWLRESCKRNLDFENHCLPLLGPVKRQPE